MNPGDMLKHAFDASDTSPFFLPEFPVRLSLYVLIPCVVLVGW